jgi:putative ABC transport system permease protein
MGIWRRFKNALLPGRLDAELEEEAASHLEEMQREGFPAAAFGNSLRYREESRDVKTIVWLDSLRADLIFGLRQLAKHKVATATAILSLALGIGATTTSLQLVEAGFLRPLPVKAPEQLHFLRYSGVNIDGKQTERDSFQAQELVALQESVRDDAQLVMVSFADRQDISFGEASEVEKVSRQYVDASFFEFMGLKPKAGRLFNAGEAAASAEHRIAIISDDYSMRRFGGNEAVIGRKFLYEGEHFQIVGIAEAAFTGTAVGNFTDVYLPMPIAKQSGNRPSGRILLRLRESLKPESIGERLHLAFRRFREDQSKQWPASTPKELIRGFTDVKLKLLPAANGVSNFHRDFRVPLMVLAVTAVMLLGLACISVASLLLTQAKARAQEMGIRIALGAGRARLIQLMLLESALLGAISVTLALWFCRWAGPWLISQMNPPDNPMRLALAFDWRMPLTGSAVALMVTLICGALPAISVSRIDAAKTMRGTARGTGRFPILQGLLGLQIGFCVVVCFVASLMVTTLRNLDRQRLGFDYTNTLLVETRVQNGLQSWPQWQQIQERMKDIPGVEEVGLSGWSLQTGSADIGDVEIEGQRLGIGGPYTFSAAAGWFKAMGIPFLEGSDFRPGSREDLVIINEQIARNFFKGRSPIGATIQSWGKPYRIIGVTGDIRMRDIKEDARGILYFPFTDMRYGTFALRLKDSSAERGLQRAIRGMIAKEFSQLQVRLIRNQESLITLQTIRERLLAKIATFFALIALGLAAMGIYAVFSQNVGQRGKEIAIRMAVGAEAWSTACMVVRDGVWAAVIGLSVGIAGAWGAGTLMRSLVFGSQASDWSVLIPAIAVVLCATLTGLALPLFKALKTDPALVLRAD